MSSSVLNMDKVSPISAKENYAAILGVMAPGAIEEVISGLTGHFAKQKEKGTELVTCDNCGGESTLDLEVCPFCGVGEDPPGAVSSASVPSSIEPSDGTTIDASAIEASGVALDPEPAQAKGKRKKVATEEKTPEEIREAKMVRSAPPTPKPSAPVLTIAGGRRAIASEKDLDDSLARFRAAAATGAVAHYVLGSELARMRDHLWQQRMEDGKPKYKTWHQFVAAETGVSIGFANKMMRLVENFTQEHLQQLGVKALMIILGAPKEDHAALLSKAEDGATTRELEDEVRQIREQKNIAVVDAGKPSPTAAAAAASAASAKAKRKEKEAAAITIGMKTEQATVKALARTKRGEPERVAKTIEDQPYAVIECMNDVKLYIALKQRPTGELEFKVTAKREKE